MSSYSVPDTFPVQIFRAYDIRGEVSDDMLNEDVAYALGLAMGSQTKAIGQDKLIVGFDVRLSGPTIKKAFVTGVIETGCDVIEIGIGPTPMLYFATHYLSANTGVMITASHNPSNHNGFKIVLDGKTLTSDGIQLLLSRMQQKDFVSGHGKVHTENITPAYINAICDSVSLEKPLKIVVDAANGAASEIAPTVYRKLGCEVVELFCEYDGRFPNHHPDPTVPDNLNAVIDAVKKERADVGLAFDGDADRLGIVTNQGEIIWPDRQMMLYAKDVLANHPGEKVMFDVKCSRLLPEAIQKAGGQPMMWQTGHSILKAKMFEENAPLAGEMSGHIFFNDRWFGFDDGIYVGARLLSILSREDRSLSEVFDALPQTVNTPELKLPMAENKKSDFMRCLLREGEFSDANKITIDGLRVEFDFGWALIRPSNTSPYLILRFEADTQDHLEKLQAIFREQLLKIDSKITLPF